MLSPFPRRARVVVPVVRLAAGCAVLSFLAGCLTAPSPALTEIAASPAVRTASPPVPAAPSPVPAAVSPAPAPRPTIHAAASPASPPATPTAGPLVRVASPEPSPAPIPVADWGAVTVPAGERIALGYAGPLTGEFANLGIAGQRGVELALLDRPAIRGVPVELVAVDDNCTTAGGIAAAQTFRATPRLAGVAGYLCDDAGVPAADILAEERIALVSPGVTAPQLTLPPRPIINRVSPNDAVQASTAARFARATLGAERAVALHDGTPRGLALAAAFRQSFEAAGGRLAGLESLAGAPEPGPLLAQVAALQPDVLYVGAQATEAAALKQGFAAAGLADLPVIGPSAIASQSYLMAAGPVVANTYATVIEDAPPAAAPAARAAFAQAYGARFGALPADAGELPFRAHDAATLLLNAIDAAASPGPDGSLLIDRNALARAVRATQGFAGVSGTLSCPPAGDCATPSVRVLGIRNGAWEPVAP